MATDSYYRTDEEIYRDKTADFKLHRDHGIEEGSAQQRSAENRYKEDIRRGSDQRYAQPLASPLHSPVHSPSKTSVRTNESKPMTAHSSRSNSEEDIGTRSVAVSVLRDSGTKVELMLKAHGLKKKKSLLNSLVTVFKKPHQPSRLLANGKFTQFVLNDNSLRFMLEVRTDKKKKKGNGNRVDTFVCEVKQFPTAINPESAEFEVLEPASGEAFILLTMIKMGNLSVNWKEFLDSNGTIDVTCI